MNQFARGAKAYQGMGQYTKAAEASPHQLISMLYEGALERLQTAKGAMEREDVKTKGIMISKAIAIIEGLRAHLDQDKGGELATNLHDLYTYMETRLFNANLHNNVEVIDEVTSLLEDLRSGWSGIAKQAAEMKSD